jgi:hypothetical protein
VTSLQPARESPSAGLSNSEPPAIEIYLFQCGHGDTLLVRLPDNRWGLIDCYLPDQGGVRRRFFKFLDEKRIRTFDFIFQTHPDRDHYHGMQAVIEHFLGRGERIEYYVDTGLNARRARDVFQSRPGGSNEYEQLQNKLEEWDKSGQLRWVELAAGYMSFVPRGHRGQIELVPVGPDLGDKRRIMTSDLRKMGTDPGARPEANALSLVVVLAVKMGDRTLSVLLGADADVESLERSLAYWNRHAEEIGLEADFDAVKVPHHGSIRSHFPGLCLMRSASSGGGTAAISAGTRRALPDREVLRDFLAKGWNVMATTTKVGAPPLSLPMTLADRADPDEGEPARHTIRISWAPEAGLAFEPVTAKITMNDLARYATASESPAPEAVEDPAR